MSPIVELGSERAAMAAFVGTVFLHGGALIYSSQEIGHEAPINFFCIYIRGLVRMFGYLSRIWVFNGIV